MRRLSPPIFIYRRYTSHVVFTPLHRSRRPFDTTRHADAITRARRHHFAHITVTFQAEAGGRQQACRDSHAAAAVPQAGAEQRRAPLRCAARERRKSICRAFIDDIIHVRAAMSLYMLTHCLRELRKEEYHDILRTIVLPVIE